MEKIEIDIDNLNEEDKKTLYELIEKSKMKEWRPSHDDPIFYAISNRGAFLHNDYNECFCFESLWQIGNCFRTIEEAEFAVEKQKVITRLKRLSKKSKENSNTTNNYLIGYDYDSKTVIPYEVEDACCLANSMIFFNSEKSIIEAIEEIGQDKLKKFYLQIEE